jgi:hypothetical protein
MSLPKIMHSILSRNVYSSATLFTDYLPKAYSRETVSPTKNHTYVADLFAW